MRRRRKGLSFYQKKKKINATLMKEILSYLFITAACFIIAFVFIFCIGMRTAVVGVSMEPVLKNSQQVFVNKIIYRVIQPKKGDIIVFLPNGNANTHYYVKRVVATGGDTIQIKNGSLYVNDLLYKGVEYDKIEDAGILDNPLKLNANEYFTLGDNINNSEDSRSANIGPVKRDNVIGKVWFHMAKGDSPIGFMEKQ